MSVANPAGPLSAVTAAAAADTALLEYNACPMMTMPATPAASAHASCLLESHVVMVISRS
jgi:hypothetical protein